MKKIISTNEAPAAVGPYSQAVLAKGELIFISGQLPINPSNNKMAEGIKDQTRQALLNIKAILESVGLGLDAVVKTTVYLQNIDDFKAMNEVYASIFKNNCPARAAFAVDSLPLGASVEIEAIAVSH